MISKDLVHMESPEPPQNLPISSKSLLSAPSRKRRRSERDLSSDHDNPPLKKPRYPKVHIKARCPDCTRINEWFDSFSLIKTSDIESIIESDSNADPSPIPEVLRTMPPVLPSKRGTPSLAYSKVTSQAPSKASSTNENATSDSNYRKHNLSLKGIVIFPSPTFEDCMLDYGEHVPDWVQQLVSKIMDDDPSNHAMANNTVLPGESQLQRIRRSLYRSIFKQPICHVEEHLKEKISSAIVTLSVNKFYSDVLYQATCQPFVWAAIENSPFMTPPKPVAKPVPDIIYGYTDDSFPGAKSRSEELASTFCNKSNIMFPYLAVEYKAMGGSIWHATNQCVGDAAVSLHQAERTVGYGQAIFTLAINDEIANLYLTWSSDAPFDENDKVTGIGRYYLTMKIRTFLILERASFQSFWKCLVNIHCWAATTRHRELTQRLIEYFNRSPSASPEPM